MGRQQRTKQGDPQPLAGSTAHPHSGAHVGKKKQQLTDKAQRQARDGSKPSAAAGAGSLKKGAKRQASSAANGAEQRPKKAKKTSTKKVPAAKEYDEDDIEGLEEQDDWSGSDEQDEAFAKVDQKNLEAARSALFNDEDLAAPELDDDEELDDEFDLDRADDSNEDEEDSDDEMGGDEFDVEGVTLDELDDEELEMTAAEAQHMPASGKKAMKRAARAAAYASDDEEISKLSGPKERAARANPVAEDGDEEGPTMADLDGMSDNDDEDGEGADSDDEDGQLEAGRLTDLRAVEKRMRTSARVLTNWRELGPSAGMSRSDLVEQLIGDICQYHGYTPYLAEKLFELFGIDEALQFFNTSDTPRPLTLRVNTLKTRRRDLAQALINRGVNLEPLEGGWSKVGLQVFSGGGVPVGATPEYLAGHYILQSASSFLPVVALDPQPHERVLDMSAAPGGKTTYMSALMGNTGEVWANDSSRGRIKGLGGNVARLGCRNVVITNVDGREFPRIIGGFDRVLLDAPCSGTGVISKDQSVKVNKTERDFTLLSHLQKQLVLSAIDSVTPNSEKGGYVVYSTCSVTTEENEAVVSYALRKRPHAKLVETGLAFGKEGFKTFRGKTFAKDIQLTRRFYPHVHNMDGFYVAKFKIGKPQKAVVEDDSVPEPYVPVVESDEEASGEDDEDAPKFNDEEDEKLIAEAKRKLMKKKGVNPRADVAKAKAGPAKGKTARK